MKSEPSSSSARARRARLPRRHRGEPGVIALNKPYGVLCQFSAHETHPTLASLVDVPEYYPAGRLDTDSEGLLLLTNHGPWQARISEPRFGAEKTYWAQIEGDIGADALQALARGVPLGGFTTAPARVRRLADEETAALWPRVPPIRVRKTVPDCWIELTIHEGKNRQVRRMTAHVGHPCLRLIRVAAAGVNLFELGLAPGTWRALRADELPLLAARLRRKTG